MSVDLGYQPVSCRSCKRPYVCTPTHDYYDYTHATDGICLQCLMKEHELEQVKTMTLTPAEGGGFEVVEADLGAIQAEHVAMAQGHGAAHYRAPREELAVIPLGELFGELERRVAAQPDIAETSGNAQALLALMALSQHLQEPS